MQPRRSGRRKEFREEGVFQVNLRKSHITSREVGQMPQALK
jgi:hypothetical protein